MLNRVNLRGRLGKDPVLTVTTSGISVCNFSIAVDRIRKSDSASVTDWINCVTWKQSADYLTQYAKKGDLVVIDGRLQNSGYKDRNTQKMITSTEVHVDRVEIISRKTQASESHEDLVPQEDNGYMYQSFPTDPSDPF